MSGEVLLIAALLVMAGAGLSKLSSRFGVPSLVLFLVLGMLAGSEGILGIEFDDVALAQQVGIVALAYILFSGGLDTSWREIRGVALPATGLATVGVLITSVVLGLLSAAVLGLDPLEGLLLGAVISATDAAAVFSILRSRGIVLNRRFASLLELESGSNDPAAVFLTVGVLALITGDADGPVDLVVLFVQQMSIGLLAGWGLARLALLVVNRLRLEYDGLYPVVTAAFVLVLFEATSLAGGSGFLAAYVAGLTMANSTFIHKGSIRRFHDAIGWLAQIVMFVVFGLLVFPSELPSVALRGVLIALLLAFVARPIAVALTLLPFRMPAREVAFTSWIGLRGATPIILATFPLVAGVAGAETIFNVVFFVVLISVLLQGTTVSAAARVFKVTEDEPAPTSRSHEVILSGDTAHSLHEVEVPEGSPAVGRALFELGLPDGVLIALLFRKNRAHVPQGGTVLATGDVVLLVAEDDADYALATQLLRGDVLPPEVAGPSPSD